MVKKYCCYGQCRSSSIRTPDLIFIPFVKPATDMKRCRRWIHLCGRSKDTFNIDKIKKDTYICQNHFHQNQVLNWHENPNLEPVPCNSKTVTAKIRTSKNSNKKDKEDVPDRIPDQIEVAENNMMKYVTKSYMQR